MKATEFKVRFKYEGIEPNRFEKYLLEDILIQVYNEWCELVNPMLAEWNREYDGPDDGWDDKGVINPDGQYVRYIRSHYQRVVDSILNPMLKKRIDENDGRSRIKRFLIGKECNFEAELNDGTIMYFYIEEK